MEKVIAFLQGTWNSGRRGKAAIVLVVLIILGLISMLFIDDAEATEYNITNEYTNNYNISDCHGVAGSMASGQHQFYITSKSQVSVAAASYNSCTGVSVGTAFTQNQVLYSLSVACELDDKCGAAGAANFTF